MAKVQIKFDSITPSGGIFSIMEQFDALLTQIRKFRFHFVLKLNERYILC